MEISTEGSASLSLNAGEPIELITYDNQFMSGSVQTINENNELAIFKMGRLTLVNLERIKDLRIQVSAEKSILVQNARFFIGTIGAVAGVVQAALPTQTDPSTTVPAKPAGERPRPVIVYGPHPDWPPK